MTSLDEGEQWRIRSEQRLRINLGRRGSYQDGGMFNVGTWIQLTGGLASPDGLALDVEEGLVAAHAAMAL